MRRKSYRLLSRKEKDVTQMVGVLVLNISILFLRYIIALLFMQPKIVSINPIYLILSAAAPIGMWIYATGTTYYNFYRRKITLLVLVYINFVMTILQLVYHLQYQLLVKKIILIPPNEALTAFMLRALSLISGVAFLGLTAYLFWFIAKHIVFTEEHIKVFKSFKITHHIDERENKDNLYDLKIMKDLNTGKDIILKEKDRATHTLNNGATGTGKTSSTCGPAAKCDLDTKMKNGIMRGKKIEQMLIDGEACIRNHLSNPSEWDVEALPGHEQKLEEIRRTYADAGMTVVAPNNSLNDTIIKLAAARDQWVNVCDPAKDYSGYANVRVVGMNSFILPYDLTEEQRVIYITNIATMFSEVLVAMNEVNARTEQYFRDINTSVTTNIAIICMLYRNIRREQTDIVEIQSCINVFENLEPMIKEIENYYNITVKVTSIQKPTKGGIIANLTRESIEKNDPVEDESSKENPYYMIIQNVKSELLGEGKKDMYSQVRGLRTLINKLLLDPRIKRLLMAKDNYLDFDGMLKHNEITLVNTALEFGAEISTGLGLFFLLNFKIAVLRRPENMRSFHSLMIDESAQYMHQCYEDMVSIFRQYNVACMFAIQSQSQFEKNQFTKYLKGVFQGVGFHIVFGRVGEDEMQMYSSLAGIKKLKMVQKTVSWTSLLNDDPSYSMSDRSTPTTENIMEGEEIRYRDFQEVTVFTVDNGRVKEAKLAKVEFVKPEEYEHHEVYKPDWKKYVQTLKECESPAAAKENHSLLPDHDIIIDNHISQIEEAERTQEKSLSELMCESLEDISAVDDEEEDEDDKYIELVDLLNRGEHRGN